MRETWSEPLATWLMKGARQLDEQLNERSVLIQVTLPAAVSIKDPPSTTMVRGPDKNPVAAQFVSRTGRVDPRFQGSIFFIWHLAKGERAFSGTRDDSVSAARRAAIWHDRSD
jgi:hypothetical protein